jgi:hypothetical protein
MKRLFVPLEPFKRMKSQNFRDINGSFANISMLM